ncbi:MAG: carbamoyltransferase HypF [Kosmotogaceae bacterium]
MSVFEVKLDGIVQGVGFRPFIARLAKSMDLKGTVENRENGVVIILECDEKNLHRFIERIEKEKPVPAKLNKITFSFIKSKNSFKDFSIKKSEKKGKNITVFPPDIAMCDECIDEMFSKGTNRYRYPFTSCAQCGPRFSITSGLPYDRPLTTMKKFPMCDDCEHEYNNIDDRRYHAQTNCCDKCGPQYFFQKTKDDKKIYGKEAFDKAVDIIKKDGIIAVKGIGGFHLMCRPNEIAVKRLRGKKQRPVKPFALLAKDIKTIKSFAYITDSEKKLLLSPARPIVLLRSKSSVFHNIAPGIDRIGVMLPYAGIHHLLMEEFSVLVATSGNISGEIICAKNSEALNKLGDFCDGFLLHDRDILNRCDDSVIKPAKKDFIFIRKSRGFIPDKIYTGYKNKKEILAFGADLKSSFGFLRKGDFIGSQYLGDLSYKANQETYLNMIKRFEMLFDFSPEMVVVDSHPNYFSSNLGNEYAIRKDLKTLHCQHHKAHIYSVMAENGLKECIGVAFDGTGYGEDGNIWGGEFFEIRKKYSKRIAHLRYVPLPGGEKAAMNPELMASSYLNAAGFAVKSKAYKLMINNATVHSSSAGRLFDAVSSILGICNQNTFEGEAPMKLEALSYKTSKTLPWDLQDGTSPWTINWVKIIRFLNEKKETTNTEELASIFHRTLADIVTRVCVKAKEITKINTVCLSGGVFQNALLFDTCFELLEEAGINVYYNCMVSPNDEGIALGQAFWASL